MACYILLQKDNKLTTVEAGLADYNDCTQIEIR